MLLGILQQINPPSTPFAVAEATAAATADAARVGLSSSHRPSGLHSSRCRCCCRR